LRVAIGISRARKQGKALGRPRVEMDPRQVAGLRARGVSWNQIAEHLGIGRGTAEHAFRSLSQKPVGGHFLEVTRRWASDTVLDSASVIGTKQSLMAHPHPLDLGSCPFKPE